MIPTHSVDASANHICVSASSAAASPGAFSVPFALHPPPPSPACSCSSPRSACSCLTSWRMRSSLKKLRWKEQTQKRTKAKWAPRKPLYGHCVSLALSSVSRVVCSVLCSFSSSPQANPILIHHFFFRFVDKIVDKTFQML